MADVVFRAPERETVADTTMRRTPWEVVLFGRKMLACAECGRELAPLDAYWQSATTVYCSPEHAYFDRG
ncbi:hypothetical protein D3C72_2538550 [compost metagenome]